MNLTPKEKARELVNIFGKESAIKVVNEILNVIEVAFETYKERSYYQQVRNEIENIQ